MGFPSFKYLSYCLSLKIFFHTYFIKRWKQHPLNDCRPVRKITFGQDILPSVSVYLNISSRASQRDNSRSQLRIISNASNQSLLKSPETSTVSQHFKLVVVVASFAEPHRRPLIKVHVFVDQVGGIRVFIIPLAKPSKKYTLSIFS